MECNEDSDMFTVTTLSSPAEQRKLKKLVGLLFIVPQVVHTTNTKENHAFAFTNLNE